MEPFPSHTVQLTLILFVRIMFVDIANPVSLRWSCGINSACVDII